MEVPFVASCILDRDELGGTPLLPSSDVMPIGPIGITRHELKPTAEPYATQ